MYTHTLSHSHTHSLSYSISLTHTLSLSHSLTHSHTLSLTPSHSCRFWVLERICPLCMDDLEEEATTCARASEQHPKNYYAWSHRLAVLFKSAEDAGSSDTCAAFVEAELKRARAWVRTHVSDYSGMHYLQMCCLLRASLNLVGARSPLPRTWRALALATSRLRHAPSTTSATSSATLVSNAAHTTTTTSSSSSSSSCSSDQEERVARVLDDLRTEVAGAAELCRMYPEHTPLTQHATALQAALGIMSQPRQHSPRSST